jgi:hypothetical protein
MVILTTRSGRSSSSGSDKVTEEFQRETEGSIGERQEGWWKYRDGCKELKMSD